MNWIIIMTWVKAISLDSSSSNLFALLGHSLLLSIYLKRTEHFRFRIPNRHEFWVDEKENDFSLLTTFWLPHVMPRKFRCMSFWQLFDYRTWFNGDNLRSVFLRTWESDKLKEDNTDRSKEFIKDLSSVIKLCHVKWGEDDQKRFRRRFKRTQSHYRQEVKIWLLVFKLLAGGKKVAPVPISNLKSHTKQS